MSIKIDFKQTYHQAIQGLQTLGQQTTSVLKSANQQFDTFVSSKNLDPKTVKQVGLGTAVGVAGLALVISCIKGIVNSIKEKVEEK
jgi:hypothetical protein